MIVIAVVMMFIVVADFITIFVVTILAVMTLFLFLLS